MKSTPLARSLLVAASLVLAACGTETIESTGSLRIEAHLEPDPPRIGQNVLHLQVSDADGNGVEAATVEVFPFMPAHGHGSTETPVIQELGDGAYLATPITLHMPGAWELNISVGKAGETGELVQHWTVK